MYPHQNGEQLKYQSAHPRFPKIQYLGWLNASNPPLFDGKPAFWMVKS